MRRIARTTLRWLLLLAEEDVLRRVAAGGRGERPRGLRWDIVTEVVEARCGERRGGLEEVCEAAEE